MNKTALVFVVILIAGVAGYFGFRELQASQADTAPIKIGIVTYPGDGVFYIAQQEGFFKKYGVNVQLVSILPDDAAQLLASNNIQMLYLTTDYLPILADGGVDAKEIFAPSMSYGADGMVVTKNIQSITDLKGQSVYLEFGSPSYFLFRYIATQSGLTASDFKLVDMSPEDVGTAFVGGKIDAGMTWEPWLSEATTRANGKTLFTSKQYPGIILDALIARSDTIADRRTDVENIMRASFDAITWWEQNPTEGNVIAAQALRLSPQDFAAQRDTIQLVDLPTNLQKFDPSKPLNVYYLVQQASGIYFEDGLIHHIVSANSVIDSSLLAQLQ